MTRDRDAESLSAHIEDLWVAFASPDPAEDPQAYDKLLNFVISRAFRKLHARLQYGEQRFKGELSGKIRQWQPTRSTISRRWVNVPQWLEECITKFNSPVTMERNIWTRDDRKEVLQWEFSDETKQRWAAILAEMLGELRRAIKKADNIRKNSWIARQKNKGRKAIADVGFWSHKLFSYLDWEEGVVQTLLTETDLADNLLSESTNQQASKNVGGTPFLQFLGIPRSIAGKGPPKANPDGANLPRTSPTGVDRGMSSSYPLPAIAHICIAGKNEVGE